MLNKSISGFLILFLQFFIFTTGSAQIMQPQNKNTQSFITARKYFIEENYQMAYPLFSDLKSNKQLPTTQQQDLEYYLLVCQIFLQQVNAVEQAVLFSETTNNDAFAKLINYHLGHYYFLNKDNENTIKFFNDIDLKHLDNEQVANLKYEKGYAYFAQKDYNNAEDLLNEISQLENSKYYLDASYYYGFLSYYRKSYREALTQFKKVSNHTEYGMLIPYYVAEMQYKLGNKEEALRYALLYNGITNIGQYADMQQLIGQIYFERKEFKKALPYFEYYANSSKKLSAEYEYQISYCYYDIENWEKAAEGLKKLSVLKDTLGQNAMYLLGDCYLKTNQKELARSSYYYCSKNSSKLKEQEVSKFIYGKLSYDLGFNDIAIISLNEFVDNYPSSAYNTEAKEWLILALSQSNNFRQALATYESLDIINDNVKRVYPKILLGRGLELFQDGQLATSKNLLEKSLTQNPTLITKNLANYWLGEINYRTDNYAAAVKHYEDYLAVNNLQNFGDANVDFAKYNLGYCYYHLNNFAKAQPLFLAASKSVLLNTTLKNDANIRLADVYYVQKQMANAELIYNGFVNSNGQDADYCLYQLANIKGVKVPTQKIDLLKKIIQNYPASIYINKSKLEIAKVYMSQEKNTDAITYLNELINDKSNAELKATAFLNKGVCLFNLNDNKNALQIFKTLIAEYPQSEEADLALPYISNIAVEEGVPEDYTNILKSMGRNIADREADSISYAVAKNRYLQGNCTGAIEAYNKYLNQFPNGFKKLEAWHNRSECALKNNNFELAVSGYDSIIAQDKNKYYEKCLLAAARLVYFELKDYKKAETYYQLILTQLTDENNLLDATRGIVRCAHINKDYSKANNYAASLLQNKRSTKDDKSIAQLVLGKYYQSQNLVPESIKAFTDCAANNKAEWGAQARYEIALNLLNQKEYVKAEKAALNVIKQTGSYEYFTTLSYILLGDIAYMQADYFNALATYESVMNNTTISELKVIAKNKYDTAKREGEAAGKITSETKTN